VFLYAFDLIELNGDDLRRDPLEVRKATLANILARAGHGIWFNDDAERPDRVQARLQALDWKASCRSGRTRRTARAARRIGSK
jgi:ATP-dependent DNA ligase